MLRFKKPLSYFKTLPTGIWMLGFVSLFTDASSELIHSLLPAFMVSLGATMTLVGLIEGTSEAAALIVKIFSGTLSDLLGRRKWLTVTGYSLSAVSKLLFPLSTTVSGVFSARMLDRIGKGVRDAPRDALISEIAPTSMRGASFGLRQSLDTVGAFMGPLMAILLMFLFSNNIYSVLWVAVIPGFIGVFILICWVKEPVKKHFKQKFNRIHPSDIQHLGLVYWKLVAIGLLLTLARFSQAFLLLRAQSIGLVIMWIPLVMVAMNIFYALSSYPAGILSDSMNRKSVLIIGVLLLILAQVTFSFNSSLWIVFLGVAFWGLHLGFTEGIVAAMITDATSENLRGTAYGIYNFVAGLSMLASNLIAGILWDRYGASSTFIAGTIFSILALVAILLGFSKTYSRAR